MYTYSDQSEPCLSFHLVLFFNKRQWHWFHCLIVNDNEGIFFWGGWQKKNVTNTLFSRGIVHLQGFSHTGLGCPLLGCVLRMEVCGLYIHYNYAVNVMPSLQLETLEVFSSLIPTWCSNVINSPTPVNPNLTLTVFPRYTSSVQCPRVHLFLRVLDVVS